MNTLNILPLARQQRNIINICMEKFKVKIRSGNTCYVNKNIRKLLCDFNHTLTIDENMSLQKQTLILAIYMIALENLATPLPQHVLTFIDKLVYCGLYNIRFYNRHEDAAVLAHLNTIEFENIHLDEFAVIAGIYGLNSIYMEQLKSDKPYNAYLAISNYIHASVNPSQVFTFARYINIIKHMPTGKFFSNKEYVQSTIARIHNSKFLNEITYGFNIHNTGDNYMRLCEYASNDRNTINGGNQMKYELFSDVDSFISVSNSEDFMYSVIMSYDFESEVEFKNITLCNEVYTALDVASYFEYAIVLVFPKTDLLNKNIVSEYQMTNRLPNSITDTYISYVDSCEGSYLHIENTNETKKYLSKDNVLAVLAAHTTEKFNC